MSAFAAAAAALIGTYDMRGVSDDEILAWIGHQTDVLIDGVLLDTDTMLRDLGATDAEIRHALQLAFLRCSQERTRFLRECRAGLAE